MKISYLPSTRRAVMVGIAAVNTLLAPFFGRSQNAHNYLTSALAADNLKNYGIVIRHCNKAVQLNPAFAEAYYLRGKAKYFLQDYKGAVKDESKATELYFRNESVYYVRASANYTLKQYKSAITDFTKIIGLNPLSGLAYYHRGLSNARLNKIKRARADYSRAIALGIGEPADLLKQSEPD